MHLVTICSVAVPWLEPLLILLVWFTQHVIKSPYPNLSPSPLHYPMPLNGGDLAIPLRPSKILPSKWKFYLFLKVSIFHTQYMTNAYIVNVVIMESGCKITIFYLKMVLKRGLSIYLFFFWNFPMLEIIWPKVTILSIKNHLFPPWKDFKKKSGHISWVAPYYYASFLDLKW